MPSLRPVDLPRFRDDILAFADSRFAEEIALLDLGADRQPHEPVAGDILKGARALTDAELFYVTAATLPVFTLAIDDPPSLSGLMWFAAPIEVEADEGGGSQTYRAGAVGWKVADGRLWLTTYIDRDSMPIPWTNVMLRQFPHTIPMGYWPAPIGYQGEPIPVEVPIGRTMLATAKTVWLLMRQPLADDSLAVYDRASRRRHQREGKEPPPVRVIALRRPAGSSSGEGGGREWHHRWMVRGHWRMAAVGEGRRQRRPVWIAPFMKGDPDKPLLGGEKVYVVGDRPAAPEPMASGVSPPPAPENA